MLTNERLEKRIEEMTYCLGKTLARLRVVEEKVKCMEQQHPHEYPKPAAQQPIIPC
ncbi:hypothetical protein QYG89_07830 [Bacillus sp. B190/17]|uniref:Uncharacterized protein n=1 Tax=Bacillus lumedeiriae TaxID=3058829 RepID=A0ABW8I7W9_9BACI